MSSSSAGAAFRKALADEQPLQIVGTINANHALLARRAGYRAVWEGLTSPAPSTSAGRVLICEWDEVSIRSKWTNEVLMNTGGVRKFKSTDEFVTELVKIKQQGYCIVDEEFEMGVVGCSAPVRDASGRIVAAINIGAPKVRLQAQLDQAAPLTRKISNELSQTLYLPANQK